MHGDPPTLSMQVMTFSGDQHPSWERLFEQARAADAVGIDRLIVSDHVAFGENLAAYGDPATGGTAGGRQPTGPDGHWLEPMTALSFIGAQTQRVRLQTGILLAALRRPAVLAKTAATIDVLTGGRLDLGVGVGWQREEYEVAGLSFEGRGRLLDHTLEVCERLWNDPVADYAADELSFERIHAMPKPSQPGGVPVWVSGRMTDRVVRRIMRFGSGWIPWGDDALDPRPGIEKLRAAYAAAERSDLPQVQGTLPMVRSSAGDIDIPATMHGIAPLVSAGVTDLKTFVPPTGGFDECAALLEPIVNAFRAKVGRT